MKANIEIECRNPETVLKSIEPDIEKSEKFDVDLKIKENKINVEIKAKDFTGLLAGINSYVRLIKVANEISSR